MRDQRSQGEAPRRKNIEQSERMTLSRRAVLGGSAATMAALAGCSSDGGVVMGKRDEQEDTFDLDSGAVRIDAEHADVSIQESDDGTVTVETIKSGSLLTSLSAVTVTARRDGETVIVESSSEDSGWLRSGPSVEIQIGLPSGVSVESMIIGNGDAVVTDVDVDSETTVETRNGDAIARNVDGGVSVESQNGDAIAEDVTGFVAAHSNNGDAIVRNCGGVLGASTTNGDVSADVAALQGSTTLESTNGDVEARLASDLDATVTAETDRGSVTFSDSPISAETVTDGYVEGTIGDGDHDLELRTTNGDISIARLS